MPSPLTMAPTASAADAPGAAAAPSASLSLAAWGITTSEQLVQMLKRPDKARADAPSVTKVQLLRGAWADDAMYVPQKAPLLLDCTLEALVSSAKNAKGDDTALTTPAYWDVAADVALACQDDVETLHGLVMKHNVLALVSALMRAAHATLWASSARALCVLLPVGIRRVAAAHIDVVNACFRDLLEALPRVCIEDTLPVTSMLWERVVAAWSPSLELGQNAKKTCKFMVGESLVPFVRAHAHVKTLPASRLAERLEAMVSASLFGAAPAKSSTLPEVTDSLTQTLTAMLHTTDAAAAAHAIPFLLRALISSVHAPEARQAPPAAIRHAVLDKALAPLCLHLVGQRALLPSVLALVATVHELGLHQPGGDDHDAWLALWSAVTDDALRALAESPRDPVPWQLLGALWTAHSATVEAHAALVLTHMLGVAPDDAGWAAASDCLQRMFHTLAMERRCPAWWQYLADAMRARCRDARSLASLVRSPVLSTLSGTRWLSQMQAHTSAAQREAMLQTTCDDLTHESDLLRWTCTLHRVLLLVTHTDVDAAPLGPVLDAQVERLHAPPATASDPQQQAIAAMWRVWTALADRHVAVAWPTDSLDAWWHSPRTLPCLQVEMVRPMSHRSAA